MSVDIAEAPAVVAMTPSPAARRPGHNLQYVGYVLAIAGLVWVIHDIDLSQALEQVAAVQWWWLLPAVAFDICGYCMQGQRWIRLLRPVGDVSPWRATRAIYAGLFANEIMPLRVGELLRMHLVAGRLRTSLLSVLPSVAFERLLDTLVLAAAIGPVVLFVPLSRRIELVADSFGMVAIAVTAVGVVLLTISPRWVSRPEATAIKSGRLFSLFSKLVAGMQEIGRTGQLSTAILFSVLILFFQSLGFWLVMIAFGIKLSPLAGVVVALVVRLGTAIPNAPANIGSYQFFCVLGLKLFSVEKTQAAGFSVFVFAVLTAPILLIGAYVILKDGLSLGSLHKKLEGIRADAPA